jgi:VWFA-related protein
MDRDRRLVRGLTEHDFEVLEDGKLQQIVAVTEVVVPAARGQGADWTREIATDVSSNDVEGRRLVVLVLDDASMDIKDGEPHWVRKVANAAIDELGPSDLAAVVHTYLGRLENFTSDKRRLRAAVDSFSPHGWGEAGVPLACMTRRGGCLVSSLVNIAEALRYAPIGRKILIVVTPGLTIAGQNTLRPGTVANTEGLRNMFRALQDTNTTIYAFDPRGLMTTAFPVPAGAIDLTTLTGGRSIRGTNSPHELVPDVFAESASYYMVGYQVASERQEGRFRPVTVRS